MTSQIEFGQDEFQLLIELKNKVESLEEQVETCEANHIEEVKQRAEMQKEMDRQKSLIKTMMYAGSRAAIIAGGGFAGLMTIGYWLMDALNFKAVTAFFKVLRGE